MLPLAELQDMKERLKETHSHGLRLASKNMGTGSTSVLKDPKREQTMLGNSSETKVVLNSTTNDVHTASSLPQQQH